jgi:hypothetical protein
MPSLSRQFICLCALVLGGALLAPPAGAAGMCRAGDVSINCGSGPQCAKAPAVCCAGKICGDGMVCAQTARGPECGVPNITRCGRYTCGEGMACVQTPRGPECAVGSGQGGGGMSDNGWMSACANFQEKPSQAECRCMLQQMHKDGFTPQEIGLMALAGANREAEFQARLTAMSQDRQVDFLAKVSNVDDKQCPRGMR